MNAFGDLLLILSLNAIAVTTSGVVYDIRRRIIFGKKHLEDEQKREKTSHMKEIVYKNLFFILYITYLSTFSKTASVLPFAYREICRDKNEDLCKTYLKADYNVKCQGQTYKHLLVLAYISTAYIFALPTATFIALWRHRREISSGADGKGVSVGREIFEGLWFLSDNYEPRTWYYNEDSDIWSKYSCDWASRRSINIGTKIFGLKYLNTNIVHVASLCCSLVEQQNNTLDSNK